MGALSCLTACEIGRCSNGKCDVLKIKLRVGHDITVPRSRLGRQNLNILLRNFPNAGRHAHACKQHRDVKATAAQMLAGELPKTYAGKPVQGAKINRALFRSSSTTLGPDPLMLDLDESGNPVNLVPNAQDFHLSWTKCIFVHPQVLFPALGPHTCPDCGHSMHQDGHCEVVKDVVDFTSPELNTVLYGVNWCCEYCPKDKGAPRTTCYSCMFTAAVW